MDIQQRMLPKKLAARYCGQPPERFASVCPVKPIKLSEADRPKWDIKELDSWIDSIKADHSVKTNQQWLDML